MIRRLLLTLTLVTVSLSVTAQEPGDGVLIIESNRAITATLHPYAQDCLSADCQRMVDLLYPQLLQIDPETGWLMPADSPDALVTDWEINGDTVTYTLADREWNDGTPITAMDVFYSYLLARPSLRYADRLRDTVIAAAPLDDSQISFVLEDANCRTISLTNFRVVYSPDDFAQQITYNGDNIGEDISNWYDTLSVRFGINSPQLSEPNYLTPTVYSGTYTVQDRDFQQSLSLYAMDGAVAYRFTGTNLRNPTDVYLRGDSNTIAEPGYDRRDDLRSDPPSQIITYPGDRTYFVALNPIAYDEDDAIIPHPILSDPIVRKAMTLALDVNAIMDAAIEGEGVALAASLPSTALGHNPDLVATTQDVITARQMLLEAGWRDADGDGVRECVSCATAEIGSELRIDLGYADVPLQNPLVDHSAIGLLLSRQLRDIGVGIRLEPTSSRRLLTTARFEMFLVDGFTDDDALRIINTLSVLAGQDAITEALAAGDNAAACNPEIRAAAYRDLDATLQSEHAHLWLFSPERMLVTRVSSPPANQTWEAFLP